MHVEWHKLGEYIEQCDERNVDGRYGVESVRGISINKMVIETKADMTGVSLLPYKLFKPNEFCFVTVTSRNGGKISLACNESGETYIVSSSYEVFRIVRDKLLPEYLNLLLRRSEFDRYARFNSWGSAREVFSFAEMARVEIPVPSIAEQRKVVEAWQGLRKMKEENAQLAEPLLALCRSYLQEIKKKYPMKEIGQFVSRCDDRNEGAYGVDSVRGISIEKKVIETKADMTNVPLGSYKLFRPEEFCYVTVTSRNGEKVSLAENETSETFIVSGTYEVFKINDKDKLSPGFLFLWMSRSEFDRVARFHSWGSARETFNWADMCRVKIPLPPIEVQQAVVDLYRCANEAKKIAAEADKLSREICPALIQRVVKEVA